MPPNTTDASDLQQLLQEFRVVSFTSRNSITAHREVVRHVKFGLLIKSQINEFAKPYNKDNRKATWEDAKYIEMLATCEEANAEFEIDLDEPLNRAGDDHLAHRDQLWRPATDTAGNVSIALFCAAALGDGVTTVAVVTMRLQLRHGESSGRRLGRFVRFPSSRRRCRHWRLCTYCPVETRFSSVRGELLNLGVVIADAATVRLAMSLVIATRVVSQCSSP